MLPMPRSLLRPIRLRTRAIRLLPLNRQSTNRGTTVSCLDPSYPHGDHKIFKLTPDKAFLLVGSMALFSTSLRRLLQAPGKLAIRKIRNFGYWTYCVTLAAISILLILLVGNISLLLLIGTRWICLIRQKLRNLLKPVEERLEGQIHSKRH
ncbi:hypothetical protein BT63DRAFT_233820 [Microthyrium microscopicum]|uniref:Uncharacterized protein n=1 Tax=Microthyrium microscopicum TaxID=703497 RepID=A0A6A6UFS6_9PEZI|nr:hypothetical protein BT63DRAFT_233820 [Microthyrium microscopicum]